MSKQEQLEEVARRCSHAGAKVFDNFLDPNYKSDPKAARDRLVNCLKKMSQERSMEILSWYFENGGAPLTLLLEDDWVHDQYELFQEQINE